jgi:hypothetical protein
MYSHSVCLFVEQQRMYTCVQHSSGKQVVHTVSTQPTLLSCTFTVSVCLTTARIHMVIVVYGAHESTHE